MKERRRTIYKATKEGVEQTGVAKELSEKINCSVSCITDGRTVFGWKITAIGKTKETEKNKVFPRNRVCNDIDTDNDTLNDMLDMLGIDRYKALYQIDYDIVKYVANKIKKRYKIDFITHPYVKKYKQVLEKQGYYDEVDNEAR